MVAVGVGLLFMEESGARFFFCVPVTWREACHSNCLSVIVIRGTDESRWDGDSEPLIAIFIDLEMWHE